MTAPNFGYDGALLFQEEQLPRINPDETRYFAACSLDFVFTDHAEPATGGSYREWNAADVLRQLAWEMN